MHCNLLHVLADHSSENGYDDPGGKDNVGDKKDTEIPVPCMSCHIIWGWAENLGWRVTPPLGPIWIYWVGFEDLGGVPIDRKLLGDRFGRILSPGNAIFVNFERF